MASNPRNRYRATRRAIERATRRATRHRSSEALWLSAIAAGMTGARY